MVRYRYLVRMNRMLWTADIDVYDLFQIVGSFVQQIVSEAYVKENSGTVCLSDRVVPPPPQKKKKKKKKSPVNIKSV